MRKETFLPGIPVLRKRIWGVSVSKEEKRASPSVKKVRSHSIPSAASWMTFLMEMLSSPMKSFSLMVPP